jgi:outer membrane protein insertion porin family
MRLRYLLVWPLVWGILQSGSIVSAQSAIVTEVRIEQESQTVTDPLVANLIETRTGQPLSMRDVRASIAHLTSLNRYDDVQVLQEPAGNGIRLRFVLYPLHPVDRVEFRGMLGLPESELRRAISDRFGVVPSAGRAQDVADGLRAAYRDHGYPQATVTPAIEPTHNPDRATMVMNVMAGPRVSIAAVDYEQADPRDQGANLGVPAIRTGVPYDAAVIDKALQDYVDEMKARGYYEARASHTATFQPEGAIVRVDVQRGPVVAIAFAGDPLPQKERERLVPVRLEGSADEDLLEDGSRAIEDYFHGRGYRDASAAYTRTETGSQLTITYEIKQGPRFTVAEVSLKGNAVVPAADLQPALRTIKTGEPFVQVSVDRAVASIRNLYLTRGFTRAQVKANVAVLPPAAAGGPDRRVQVEIAVVEGPRTLVRSVMFRGNTVLSAAELTDLLKTSNGQPYSQVQVAGDRDRLDLEYRNRGYETVVVNPDVTLAEGDTRADIVFTISEGPQVLVDHVIILGNERTSAAIIDRELLLRPGQPLGYSARLESQQRLSALGLFRRVSITELPHAAEPQRDVLVQVEEAPPTTIGYGGGLEVGSALRRDEGGETVERFEFVPRAFFEIGRRNMWGKNRSVNLFTRVALRSQDIVLTDNGLGLEDQPEGLGFNEYRVYGTYREPKAFNTRADLLLTGILDQARRASFNFRTREVRAETGLRLSPKYSLAGRYSLERTELFDETFNPDEQPLIDRLFPQVRLSKFSGTFIRDGRDDVIDPSQGRFFIVDADVAARGIGSEVGFLKTYLQGFSFTRLPTARRVVLALGARLGAAHGFSREVPRLDSAGQPVLGPDGSPVVDTVQDLPASERFFAGGDTTVRGFSLDRLGSAKTITAAGFPTGGNSVIVLNGELRAALFGALQGVVFLDGGNVFPNASDLDLTDMRAAAGFGFRYKSPVGPIRVDLGFKLDRRELVPGRLERRSVLHISLGQAF